MGLSVLKELSEIRKAEFYSIIAEATDVSRKEQLIICIRWVDDNFNIHEDPIELLNVPQTDAKTWTACIKDCCNVVCQYQCRG